MGEKFLQKKLNSIFSTKKYYLCENNIYKSYFHIKKNFYVKIISENKSNPMVLKLEVFNQNNLHIFRTKNYLYAGAHRFVNRPIIEL